MPSDGQKRYFSAGIAAGIVGGILASLFVAFTMKLIDLSGSQPPLAIVIEFIIVAVALFAII